jgi:pimeloyl-ACP methyl ester carboxylesterase
MLREIPNGGHFVHRDRAPEWAAIVGGWLEGPGTR